MPLKPSRLLVKNMQSYHLSQFTLIKEISVDLASCKSLLGKFFYVVQFLSEYHPKINASKNTTRP